MAKSLKKRRKNLGGRPAIYPWTEWFARGRFTLLAGYHYRCRTELMCQQIRNKASQLGVGSVMVIASRGRIEVGVLRGSTNGRNGDASG